MAASNQERISVAPDSAGGVDDQLQLGPLVLFCDVFDLAQVVPPDFTVSALLASFQQRRGPQQAADVVRAESGLSADIDRTSFLGLNLPLLAGRPGRWPLDRVGQAGRPTHAAHPTDLW
jgi:hypothetical protein